MNAQAHQQPMMPMPMAMPMPTLLTPDEREQLDTVRGFMGLSDAEVASLPPENRAGVQQIRDALNAPLEKLVAANQTDLLALRDELMKLFNKERGLV